MPEYVCARLHGLYEERTLNFQGHAFTNGCFVTCGKLKCPRMKYKHAVLWSDKWRYGFMLLWNRDSVVRVVQGKNDSPLIVKHLYNPLSAHPLMCLCAASVMHLPSHARTTWSSLSRRACVWLTPLYAFTHSHHRSPSTLLSGDSWHASFSQFRFIQPCSCAGDLAKDVSLMRGGGSRVHPRRCFDFWGRSRSSTDFCRPGRPTKEEPKPPLLSGSLAELCLSMAALTMPTQDPLRPHLRHCTAAQTCPDCQRLSRNDLRRWMAGRCWSPEICPFEKPLLAFKE